MNDCPNVDVRDLLPDLVHGRLDAAARAMVEAHVANCTDCAAELELLRQLRGAQRTPTVDIASIVAAVPAYRTPRRSWVGWRAAAVITVMVAGASSVAVLQRGVPASTGVGMHTSPAPVSVSIPQPGPTTTPKVAAGVPRSQPSESIRSTAPVTDAIPAAPMPPVSGAVRELAMGGGTIGDLDDRELASLLKDIESLDAVPSVEVESTPTSPIAPSAPAGP